MWLPPTPERDSVTDSPADANSCGGRVSGRLRHLALESEAFVTFRRHFVALLAVDADTPEVRHEDARLAGDISAYVPGVGERKQQIGRASCREKSVDLGGRRIIKKKKKKKKK